MIMKNLKYFTTALFLVLSAQLYAQTDKATTERIIEAQNYVFVATTAYPLNQMDIAKVMSRMSGPNNSGSINLTGSSYDLNVKKDSLVAYLPYYGRSYTARIGSNEGGIKFKSKDFKYNSVRKKKGNWVITMKPNDVRDSYNSNYSLTLNVSTGGYGTLVVTSNNQQPISFYGYLAEQKVKKAEKQVL
jgi:hypothetical protein